MTRQPGSLSRSEGAPRSTEASGVDATGHPDTRRDFRLARRAISTANIDYYMAPSKKLGGVWTT